MIRRSVAATAAGLAAFACCVAGSLFQHVRLVARVDGTSTWVALHSHWNAVYVSWQVAMRAVDWLLFTGVALGVAAAVVTRPAIRRFASGRRRTE